MGGRPVLGLLRLASAVPMYLVSWCNTYWQFFIAGLGFGFTETSFAVGIAYTSVWFPKQWQGTALGIFGAGNAGAALTSLGAPHLLNWLTDQGQNLDGWRRLPQLYAVLLVVTGVLFLLLSKNLLPAGAAAKSLVQRLAPLKRMRAEANLWCAQSWLERFSSNLASVRDRDLHRCEHWHVVRTVVIIVTSLHRDFLSSSWATYAPTVIEMTTFIGSFGLFFTCFLLFCRFVPVIAIAEVKGVLTTTRSHSEQPTAGEAA